MCGIFERKKTWFLKKQKKTNKQTNKLFLKHEAATKNGQVHH